MGRGQHWKVVGGVSAGGILVRSQLDTTSPEAGRLATGSIVEELSLVEERLHYRRISGKGPTEGWVSLKLKDKPLLVSVDTARQPVRQTQEDPVDSALAGTGDLEITVTLDHEVGFSTNLIVRRGLTCLQLKERLAAGDPTGQTKVTEIGLCIPPTHGGGGPNAPTPLRDDTQLTEAHLHLDLCTPAVDTFTPASITTTTPATPPGQPLQFPGVSHAGSRGGCRWGSLFVPWVPPIRGLHVSVDEELLRWMAQKCHLRQDMFLTGDPGPHLRQAAIQLAALEGREVEYVAITPDTAVTDLKQRREIRNGHLCFQNSAVVEAALHGRLLILEGIEKAERNVLPMLNNLLENREMALEDGSFLMAPGREMEICQAAQGGRKLLSVSRDFLVIAIGLPVAKYHGSPLDPPLRSRFACRAVGQVPGKSEFQLLQAAAPGVPQNTIRKLLVCMDAWRASGDPLGAADANLKLEQHIKWMLTSPRIPKFPELGLLSVARILELFPGLPPATALHRAFPFELLGLSESQQQVVTNLLTYTKLDKALTAPRTSWCYTVEGLTVAGNREANVTFQPQGKGQSNAIARCPVGPWPLNLEAASKLMPSQRVLLAMMLQDHCAGMDICLVGSRGVGKTTLVRAFAEALGYQVQTVFCFKDMTSRDLTQRRGTDEQGNTEWHLSPLLHMALAGGVAVLDGVHRLPPGLLCGALGRLFSDRALHLPDGTQLVPKAQWDMWLEAGASEASLLRQGFRAVHPAFRLVATAERAYKMERPWLDDEVLTLFHFLEVPTMQHDEQLLLVRSASSIQDERPIKGLLDYMQALQENTHADPALEPMQLSTRQLLHAARHLASRSQDIDDVVLRSLSAYYRFLPPPTREGVTRIIHKAMQAHNVKITLGNLDDSEKKSSKAAFAEARSERIKLLEEKAAAIRFSNNSRAEEAIASEVRALAEEAKAENDRYDTQVARDTRKAIDAAMVDQHRIVETTSEVVIGDVSYAKRNPTRPELVPWTHFVDIPQHVATLRVMLIDWSLGRHLLLIGNQGIGKNKLADRFLGLLCVEREYVQLHRDTTVQSLTQQPVLKGGAVEYEDSPLVRAARFGWVLVVDEADKAPLEVVCILKSLTEDGELALGDGRCLMRRDRVPSELREVGDPSIVPIADGFRMIVLANRPGFPFLGNDFYRECGDVFASHAVETPDLVSEAALLKSYGPSVPANLLVRLMGLFGRLRQMVDEGLLAYPYSTRELVRIVSHLDAFPEDDADRVLSDVFAFDWHDTKPRETLSDVLAEFGVKAGLGPDAEDAEDEASCFFPGDPNEVAKGGADVKSSSNYEADNDSGQDEDGAGDDRRFDKNAESEKQKAVVLPSEASVVKLVTGQSSKTKPGGSGSGGKAGSGTQGSGTQGFHGKEGVKFRSDGKFSKNVLPEAIQKFSEDLYTQRLEALGLESNDESLYASLHDAVAEAITAMRLVFQSHEAKERERNWLKQQVQGELDDARLVDGIVGARNIYMRRGDASHSWGHQVLPKRIKFVLDVSGSMYAFNRVDQRLQRLQEAAVFIFESLSGLEHKYQYAMVGHSGKGPEALPLVPWGRPPTSAKQQLAVVQKMSAHAQYAQAGDCTLDATDKAIQDVVSEQADEYFVFVVSDADMTRYGITAEDWDKRLMQNPKVNAYVLLITSNLHDAEQIREGLSPGHGFVIDKNERLPVTFKQVFQTTMLRNRM